MTNLKSGGTGQRPASRFEAARNQSTLTRIVCRGMLFIWLLLPAVAEAATPYVEVPVTDTPPVIDGRLEERVWLPAAVITNFTQVLPVEGAAPTEWTEVRLLRNRDYLYFGIRCSDREPDRILVKEMGRDSRFRTDDYVEIGLDTFFQQREGYFFAFNPAGARADGLIENFDEHNRLWDTVWYVKARVDDKGWTAEVAIPFKSLSFDRAQTTWGCNIGRVIRRKQESVRWSGISRARRTISLAEFGELRGLRERRQGLGLEVKPAASLKYLQDDVLRKREWDFKPSLDLTYHLTPALKVNATLNTDFAEAEVDERLVNLTRFPLFFPEKRDFFLQDASLFRFGGLDEYPITPFYSRRMGLDPDGRPVDIVAGGRLTGRLDGTQIALLDVQQDSYDGVDTKNLFVGRVSTRILEESDVGALLTYGDPLSNGNTVVGGADFNYLNSHLFDTKSLVGHAWFLGSMSDRLGGNDAAFSADLDYPNEPLDVHLIFRQLGEKFDPALGFIRRRGIRDYIASMRYIWRPNTPWVRSVSLGVRPIWTTDLRGRLVAEDHDLPILSVYSPQLDMLRAFYTYDRDVLDEPFEIHTGLVIPPGDYVNDQVSVGFYSSDARPVGLDLTGRTGNFYAGTRTDYQAALDLRPIRYISTRLSYDLSQIRLPWGDFEVRIVSAQLDLAATPDLTWKTLAQYDNISDELGLNSRVRWTWRPGYDLYLVYNQGYLLADWTFQRLASEITLKAVASIRF